MFQFHHPKVPSFQIDPNQQPIFKLLQPVNDGWVEVGYVWAVGKSRTSSTEHWYLYQSVPAGSAAGLAPYTWAGTDASGRLVGITLRLDPIETPDGQSPSTFKHDLEAQFGVSVTYVQGDMSNG